VRVFAAGLFNESNGLVATPTVRADFEKGGIWRSAEPEPGARSSATVPVRVWAQMAAERGDTFLRGLVAYSQPGGRLLRSLYEEFRDEILADLKRALPVDAVLLSMHGSMGAQGYDDPEADILERVRGIVGPSVPVGMELDLHCNVTRQMVEHATALIAYKEWPHVDMADRATELYAVIARAVTGEVRPHMALHDCRIVGTFPTLPQPMRGFVDSLSAAEQEPGVLSVSLAHGFPWGNNAHMTSKVIVVTDGKPDVGQALAQRLGREFWDIREAAVEQPEFGIDEAIDYGLAAKRGPIVIGDPADSLGGGNPCDSTFVLARVVERGVTNVAFGPIYDPSAVEACCAVGEGQSLRLRVGGKVEALSGLPVDLDATVVRIRHDAEQAIPYPGAPPIRMGLIVWIKAAGDIDIILTKERVRTLSASLFAQVDCDLSGKQMVFCKMWRHGIPGFEDVAAEIHFVGSPGGNNLDYAAIPAVQELGPYWPKVEDPFRAAPARP
jgi:microcystin degradation protein MlrC